MKDNKYNFLKEFFKTVFALYGAWWLIECVKGMLK